MRWLFIVLQHWSTCVCVCVYSIQPCFLLCRQNYRDFWLQRHGGTDGWVPISQDPTILCQLRSRCFRKQDVCQRSRWPQESPDQLDGKKPRCQRSVAYHTRLCHVQSFMNKSEKFIKQCRRPSDHIFTKVSGFVKFTFTFLSKEITFKVNILFVHAFPWAHDLGVASSMLYCLSYSNVYGSMFTSYCEALKRLWMY